MAEPLAWLNGRRVPLDEARISILDPALVLGACVVDNARTWHGRLFRWADHLARLRRDCTHCRVPLNFTDEELTAAAAGLLHANRAGQEDLHVITVAAPAAVWMYTQPVDTARQAAFTRDGASLRIVGHQPVASDSLLPPRVKHRSRLHWHIARQAAGDAIPLLLDRPGGTVLETDIACVLAVVGGTLVTPPRGLILDSIALGVVLDLAAGLGFRHTERPLPVEDLRAADEVLLAGSGVGVVGVSRLDVAAVPWPGPIYESLSAAWDRAVRAGVS